MSEDSQNNSETACTNLLFQLASSINWIMQHEMADISFERLLEDFGMILNASRMYIFKRDTSDVKVSYKITELWDVCANRVIFDGYVDEAVCPIFIKRIEEKKSFIAQISKVDCGDKNFFNDFHVKSIACVPILNPDQTVYGFLGFDDCIDERTWSKLEISAIQALSATIGTIVYKMSLKEKSRNIMKDSVLQLREYRRKVEETIKITQSKLLQGDV